MTELTNAPKKYNLFKRIWYYFRIDFTTIQGRLTGGFLSMALISFILIQGANYQWGLMLQNRNFVLERIIPVKYFASALNDKVQESIVAVEKAFVFNDEQFLKEYENIWLNGVKTNRDSLEKYVKKAQNNTVSVLFSKIDNQLTNLKAELNQLKSVYVRRKQIVGIDNVNQRLQKSLQTDIALIVSDLRKTAEEIIIQQDNTEKEYDEKYQNLAYWRDWIVAGEFVVAVAVAAFIGSLLILLILRRIRSMRDSLRVLTKGDIPPPIPEAKDELNSMVQAVNELAQNLQVIKTFATEVGQGRFDSEVAVFGGKGELGTSLAEMRNSLKAVYEQEQLRAWATAGLAKFSEILRRNTDNLEMLCTEVISETVRYLGINQGGIFVLNKTEKEPFLELKGMYAFDKKKSMQKQIRLGEGLLGQAFLEGGVVHIKQVPPDYALVKSGLGNLQPKSILIVPLEYNEEVIGCFELGSFTEFEQYQIDFVKSIAEVTASTIISVFANDSTRRLLSEMKSKTDAIREQEEYLRQNTQELIHSQEELEKNLLQSEKEIAKLRLILDSVSDAILVYSEKGIIQFANRQAENMFGYESGELQEVSVRNLLDILPDEIRSDFAATRTRRAEGVATKDVRKIKAVTKNGLRFDVQMQVKNFETGQDRLLVATIQNLSGNV
ncbi:GAF domain-containing protein [Raineya orbicola]|jgi:PAS domain S-box-containing protein|uniref:PAS domain S-box protein n=1 Tax=Raineya orbicola TaxID=2016530 RepID=A0A2N3IJY7_9BACT|nr:GAF domain-containing protein [Raineya orbicola]PKQ70639.1 PAS domain S-box protein [Raineya orbicola]